MKIKTEYKTFVIPINNGMHLIYENGYKNELIDCLNNYFGLKKKNKCVILDDDEEIINQKEAQFIYISSKEDINSIFEFKSKTLLNTELEKMIEENQTMYKSLENIRSSIRELLTDEGMYKFLKIIKKGPNAEIKVSMDNFSISKILQSLKIDVEETNDYLKYIFLYNLLIYINRKKFSIVCIDFKVNEEVAEWIKMIKNDNTIILVSNDSLKGNLAEAFDSIIVLSEYDYLETLEFDKAFANAVSYIMNPIVLNNIEYQNEKIIEIMRFFEDKNASFLVKFTANNLLESFK